jgi:hypothetical protein
MQVLTSVKISNLERVRLKSVSQAKLVRTLSQSRLPGMNS